MKTYQGLKSLPLLLLVGCMHIKEREGDHDNLIMHQYKYVEGIKKLRKNQEKRMGYPLTGTVRGEFTENGWRLDRANDAIPLIDNRILGRAPNSIADILLINIGAPLPINGHINFEQKDITDQAEIEIIRMLSIYYNYPHEEMRGYVTAGGTEGNLACLWWCRESVKNNFKPTQSNVTPILYTSRHAHYSIHKIANILGLELKFVKHDKKGKIDTDDFKHLIKQHQRTIPLRPFIVSLTAGTTQLGAIDDIVAIKKILSCEIKNSSLYAVHMDAALLGAVLPLIKPFGSINSIFDYVDTFSVSGHKFFGTISVCGVALVKQSLLERAFSNKNKGVQYISDIEDTTIAGTRSGHNILELHNTLHILGLNDKSINLSKLVAQCLSNAAYLSQQLQEICGEENVLYNQNQFMVVFPKPINEIISKKMKSKYDLMTTDAYNFGICVLPHVDKDLIDRFLIDYKKSISYK